MGAATLHVLEFLGIPQLNSPLMCTLVNLSLHDKTPQTRGLKPQKCISPLSGGSKSGILCQWAQVLMRAPLACR